MLKKREMIRMTFDPKKSNVIPKIKGQWKQNNDGTIECWFTRKQYDEIAVFVDALESDFQSESEQEMVGVT